MPLTRKKPLNPGKGFKRPERGRQPVVVCRLEKAPNYAACSVAAPVEKERPVRSEPYRRLVASLGCIYCGIEGFTQHAHANTGKGAGIKTDDRFAFPLCADRPDQRGCHSLFDQGALFSKAVRREVEKEWARRTAQYLIGAGLWPAGLDIPEWAEA